MSLQAITLAQPDKAAVEWRRIPGFPDYEVSSEGQVRSYRRAKLRYLSSNKTPSRDGYFVIRLFDEHGVSRGTFVHLLVLAAFCGPRPPGMEARHLDGRGGNNNLSNLEWADHATNCQDQIRHGTTLRGSRNPFNKLTVEEVQAIRTEDMRQVDAARKYGVSAETIRQIRNRTKWKWLQ